MTSTLLMAGIGGQGVVLATKLLGHAATSLGRFCLHFAEYGGEMRGTPCQCTVSIADEPIADWVVPQDEYDIGLFMHPESVADHLPHVKPDGMAIFNASLIDLDRISGDLPAQVIAAPFTGVAMEQGNEMLASMIALGFLLRHSIAGDLADPDTLIASLSSVVPVYRQDILEADANAIKLGFALDSSIANESAMALR